MMKKFLSLLTIISLSISAIYLQAHEQETHKASMENQVIDQAKLLAAKKHSDKAWRGVDRVLTKIIVTSALLGTIGYALPPFANRCLDCEYVDKNSSVVTSHVPPYKRVMVKQNFVQTSFLITGIAALIKAGVKIKRAYDHDKNIISFIIADAFADIK